MRSIKGGAFHFGVELLLAIRFQEGLITRKRDLKI